MTLIQSKVWAMIVSLLRTCLYPFGVADVASAAAVANASSAASLFLERPFLATGEGSMADEAHDLRWINCYSK